MKNNSTNNWKKHFLLAAALLITFTINAQQLLAEYIIKNTTIEANLASTESYESELVYMEDWMNEPNWLMDSSVNTLQSSTEITIEDWMSESFKNAEEDALELEEWMVQPFETEDIVKDESIELEEWMLDTKQW